MTQEEVKNVLAAWEAAPDCAPPEGASLTDDFAEAAIRDALHRRLLELGAFVQPAAGNGYLVYNQTNQGSIAWSPDSLIIAMARGIIALAKENP